MRYKRFSLRERLLLIVFIYLYFFLLNFSFYASIKIDYINDELDFYNYVVCMTEIFFK